MLLAHSRLLGCPKKRKGTNNQHDLDADSPTGNGPVANDNARPTESELDGYLEDGARQCNLEAELEAVMDEAGGNIDDAEAAVLAQIEHDEMHGDVVDSQAYQLGAP